MDGSPSPLPLTLRPDGTMRAEMPRLHDENRMDDNGGDEVQLVLREERTVAIRGSPARLTQQLQPTTLSPSKESSKAQIDFLHHQFQTVRDEATAYADQVRLEASNRVLEQQVQFEHCAREFEQQTSDEWN